MNDLSHVPKVSVLVGVYNAEKYIGEMVESLLAQTFRDFELIVVDDGSTDNSGALLQHYAGIDPRIRIITQENQGVGPAVNRAFDESRGIYIARADADDYSYPQRLEKQVAFMDSNPDVVAMGTGVMLVDPIGIPIGLHPQESSHEEIVGQLLRGNGSAVCQPSVMLRRDAFQKVGGYDPRWRVAEDLDLFLRLAEIGRLANMTEVLVNWRQHLGSANHSRREMQINMARALLGEAYARRGLTFDASKMNDRPDVPPAIRLQRWGWNALSKGYRKHALSYALKSLQAMPFSWQSYKLLACVVRGR